MKSRDGTYLRKQYAKICTKSKTDKEAKVKDENDKTEI